MRGVLRHFALLFIAPVLFGCASAPTQEQMANADYGRRMSAEECASIAKQAVAYKLKDPSSAQFRNVPCYKGASSSVPILGLGIAFGYIQKGEVNGKNSYGGYVGFKPYQALLKNGAVVRSCIANKNGLCVMQGR